MMTAKREDVSRGGAENAEGKGCCDKSGESDLSHVEDAEVAHFNELTSKIIGCAIRVHRELGPGLLESVYSRCLTLELRNSGFEVVAEVPVPVRYLGQSVADDGFRIDLLVNGEVVLELKSVEELKPVHKKQLLTYLRLSRKKVGLLINFNEPLLCHGIVRIVNGLDDKTNP